MQQMKEQHSDYHNAEQIRPTNKYKHPIQRKHNTEAMDINCTTLPQSINKNNQTKNKNWLLTPSDSNIIKKINTPHLELPSKKSIILGQINNKSNLQ